MADFDYYGADYGVEQPSRLMEAARNFGFANWAGALTSLGLTAGMAVWAVDLTFRDVSGVPVIRAMEGPMRVEPENPGGTVAPFQGLALSDITSGGAAAPAPDQIVLAPPPVSLDAPALGDRMASAEKPETVETPLAPEDEAPDTRIEVAAIDGAPTPDDTLPEQVAAGVPAPEIVAAIAAATAAAAEPEVVVAAAGPGVALSSRPRQRPANMAVAAVRVPATVPTEAPASPRGTLVASADATSTLGRDVDPTSVVPGTRVVQLGAFDSEAIARSEWERLEGRFGDYMAGKGRLIQKANSGGRDFWRLRVVGFDDGSDARRFCAELLAKDAACIPVTVR
ncbi:SPOR domain-containing protein [Jannaschia rubra]|uniref:Sporulation related domain protein n=1 Tax=Jannaschia rubra TaxID=282197 RepID=A0A0M6XQK3_9RHOB|nr:SPOR domain-containing protein [Jannaschia rubra]CTQ32431.1 Sporulation related domain protein [Jannaschia rubra]SFG44480.1 Sporulation related domain-containing protein [Jannaschia rubra]